MRLIDSETVKEYLKRVIWGADSKIDKWVEAMPTIDAIPMNWMDAQIRGYASALKSTELKALVLVKQMWEKAQEAR